MTAPDPAGRLARLSPAGGQHAVVGGHQLPARGVIQGPGGFASFVAAAELDRFAQALGKLDAWGATRQVLFDFPAGVRRQFQIEPVGEQREYFPAIAVMVFGSHSLSPVDGSAAKVAVQFLPQGQPRPVQARLDHVGGNV